MLSSLLFPWPFLLSEWNHPGLCSQFPQWRTWWRMPSSPVTPFSLFLPLLILATFLVSLYYYVAVMINPYQTLHFLVSLPVIYFLNSGLPYIYPSFPPPFSLLPPCLLIAWCLLQTSNFSMLKCPVLNSPSHVWTSYSCWMATVFRV